MALNTAPKIVGGQFEDGEYGTEVIYSGSDQDYDFGEDNTWPAGEK